MQHLISSNATSSPMPSESICTTANAMMPADATCNLRARHILLSCCSIYCRARVASMHAHVSSECIENARKTPSSADTMRARLRHVVLVFFKLAHCVQAPYLQIASSVPAHGDKARRMVSLATRVSRSSTGCVR